MTTKTLTSDEVNFLIFRYLQESGFKHAAFTFGYESNIHKTNVNFSSEVPPGALISFLQKGIQYLEIETKMRTKETGALKYSSPLELLVPSLRNKITQPTRSSSSARNAKRKNKQQQQALQQQQQQAAIDSDTMDMDDDDEMEEVKAQTKQKRSSKKKQQQQRATSAASATSNGGGSTESGMEVMREEDISVPDDRVTILRGHTHEVFICAWSPIESNTLASGSGDSTARIWSLPPNVPCGAKSTEAAIQSPVILPHAQTGVAGSKDVTTLDWSGNGEMLATGSYDGKARIWQRDGQLKMELDRHKGPIFSLKWNRRGDYLLSGSVDNTAIIWDVKTGQALQQFKNHAKPTLDVDWRDDLSFATCSTDKMIYVCKLGEEDPLKKFRGHQDEVNAIRWDPSGSLLASCSDDFTAKIWNMNSESHVWDFKEHTKEIYTIKWSPTGPGTNHPNKNLVLASASFDSTIKIWDVEVGKCIHNLTNHTDPVYSVSFSPDGDYLASGSFDRCLHIWSVKDGSLVKTYKGSGSIFEVCWNSTGDKVAACFSNSLTEDFTVSVIDFRM